MNVKSALIIDVSREVSAAGLGVLLFSTACTVDVLDEPSKPPVTTDGGSAGAGARASMAGAAGNPGDAGSSSAGVGGLSSQAGAGGSGGVAPMAGASGNGSGNGNGGNGGNGGSATGGGPVMPVVTPCATNQLSQCSGSPLACHFGGEPGNYEVTVQLGGSGQTAVEAEFYRRMLTQSTAGEAQWFSFVTNVRVYEGEPLRPDQDSGVSKGTPGLDVYFRGAAPKPLGICYKPLPKPLMIWLEGDSTVTDQQSTAYSGWGQHLPQHFVSPVSVANYADSGESSGSVLNHAKLWGAIKSRMTAGDWVMLQVGHNDKTTTAAAFRSNVLQMINDTKAASAHMVLVTPISRASGALSAQHVNSVGANLPQIVRDLGKSESVPVIDLTVTTYDWLQTIEWQDYFANGTDQTHTNQEGADVVSGFVRDAVRAQLPDLAKYLR